jgi:hypothetical protein
MAPICIAMKKTVVAYYEHGAQYVAKQEAPHHSLKNNKNKHVFYSCLINLQFSYLKYRKQV